MASLNDACIHCNRGERDRRGNIKHEAWCPQFMRGPDPGGDPHEWPSLLDRDPSAELLADGGTPYSAQELAGWGLCARCRAAGLLSCEHGSAASEPGLVLFVDGSRFAG